MRATVFDRSFNGYPRVVGFDMFVNRYSWNRSGGPLEASISIRGDVMALMDSFNCLRCPIVIYDYRGEPVWWGMIYKSEVRWGSQSCNVSMGSMANDVCVKYTKVVSGDTDSSQVTAWVQDDDSIAYYGTKQSKINGGERSQTEAETYRDNMLQLTKLPRQVMKTEQTQGGSDSGLLTCIGWYRTLGWKFYTNGTDSDVDTGTQIGTIATATGQFLTNVETITTGINRTQLRDGARNGTSYIKDLIDGGCSDGSLLVCTVDVNRRFTVSKVDAYATADYIVDERDRWTTSAGVLIPRSICPVGKWVQLMGVMASYNFQNVFPAGNLFIEQAEYDASSDALNITPLGAGDSFDVVEVE